MNDTMEKSGFTPGPWSVDFNGLSGYGDNGNTFNINAGDEQIASLPSAFRLLDTDDRISPEFVGEQANAHLIAAAPDLLVACKAALGAFESNNAIDWSELEKAILKAEPAQP